MRNLIFTLSFLFMGSVACGQASGALTIGTRDSLYSAVLKEQRHLLIHLPDNYNPKRQYPVAYLLDGDAFFHFFTGITDHLSGTYVIPEMIVVGVVNTDRGRDFTPTAVPESHPKPNGGGALFTAFLEGELIPYISSRYAAAPYRMLLGHSLGGLLAVHLLVNRPALFDAYAVLDPALWWDGMKLNGEAANTWKTKPPKERQVFLAMSGALPAGIRDTTELRRDTTNGSIGGRSVLGFRDVLAGVPQAGSQWQFKLYPDESHGSLPLVSSYDALKFFFGFYKRPSFVKLTDSTARVLEQHYEMVSRKLRFTILPPEDDLRGLAWRSRVLEDNYERALLFLRLYHRLYGESAGVYEAFGEYYEGKGDKAKAQEAFAKAAALQGK